MPFHSPKKCVYVNTTWCRILLFIIRNWLDGELGAKKKKRKGRELFTDSLLNLLARRRKLMEISILLLCFHSSKKWWNMKRKKKMLSYILSVLYIQIGFWLKYILVALTGENLSVKKKLEKDNVLLFGIISATTQILYRVQFYTDYVELLILLSVCGSHFYREA